MFNRKLNAVEMGKDRNMNAEQERKLDQVRKLLELAKSDNVNEASTAAAQAQRLMSKFQITEAMIEIEAADNETEIADNESVEKDLLHRHNATTMPTWKITLASGMCRVNQCRVLIGAGLRGIRPGYLNIVGRPSDASRVRYLFSYVCREIDRLTKQEAASYGHPGRVWCNNFRLGAVEEVVSRMRDASRETRTAAQQEAGNGAALVLVNRALERIQRKDAEAAAWVKKNTKGTHRYGQSSYDGHGREAGRRAGASINLDAGGRAPLSAGARASLNR